MPRAYGSPCSFGHACEWTEVHPYNMNRAYGSGAKHAGSTIVKWEMVIA
jgi:hypothetical protein